MTNTVMKLNDLNYENSKLNTENSNMLITVKYFSLIPRPSTVCQALKLSPYFHPNTYDKVL